MGQQDERRVAQWICAVTGNASMATAAAGEQDFLTALQSGKVFCDLLNAIWPGCIVGILRGEVIQFRREENLSWFCQACVRLGMNEKDLFAPADLATGRESLRDILRCLF